MKILSPVYVLGANNAGDGGGRLFVWDPNTPQPPYLDDNAGIVLTSKQLVDGSTEARGISSLQKSLGQNVALKAAPVQSNVKWFGATGDGVADDAN